MSEATPAVDLDLREQIARIDRAQAETQKFAAEQRKLTAEAAKFTRDPWFLVVGALIAALPARKHTYRLNY